MDSHGRKVTLTPAVVDCDAPQDLLGSLSEDRRNVVLTARREKACLVAGPDANLDGEPLETEEPSADPKPRGKWYVKNQAKRQLRRRNWKQW